VKVAVTAAAIVNFTPVSSVEILFDLQKKITDVTVAILPFFFHNQ